MTPVADLFEVLLKTLTDRIALAGFFLALLFWTFAKVLPDSSAGQWANTHLVLIDGVGLFSICYLPTRYIIEAVDGKIVLSRKHKNLRKHLETLGTDDKDLLHSPVKARKISFQVGIANYHIAKSLEKRGLISESDRHPASNIVAFAVDKDAFDYLVQHPDLVGIKKDS